MAIFDLVCQTDNPPNLVLERTVARQSWIAEKLAMRSAANVSQQVRRYRAKRPRLTAALKEYLQSVRI